MINVTEYLKNNGKYNTKVISKFLSLERVKYFIGSYPKVISKRGRYNSHTSFAPDLFDIFIMWMERKPLPLLNRKEHEVNVFINTYYPNAIRQHKVGSFFVDWYIPSIDIIIEYNEKHHKKRINQDKKRQSIINSKRFFIINEVSAMQDLARLVKLFPN